MLLAALLLAGVERAAAQTTRVPEWAFAVSAAAYLLPDAGDFLQPTFMADRAKLHLMARYNYEDFETGSLWAGFNLRGGDKLSWTFTPIAGVIIGRTDGVALGFQGSLSWWKLEFYSESEYVMPTGAAEQEYFYTWSELSVAVVPQARVGIVTQRTRLYQSERDVQPGLFAGLTVKATSLTGYVFNPGQTPTVVLAFNTTFDFSGGGAK